jgi:hypothetical protein
VYCLLDAQGTVVERGSIATTEPELTTLVRRLLSMGELTCGQEVGTMSHFVHDVVTSAGATILSFNAHHLRMIASSRKKTDKRDAFWIAKCLQTGMMPHPVHVPTAEVRRLQPPGAAHFDRRRAQAVDASGPFSPARDRHPSGQGRGEDHQEAGGHPFRPMRT